MLNVIHEYIWNYLVISLNTLQILWARISESLHLPSQILPLYSESLPLLLPHTGSGLSLSQSLRYETMTLVSPSVHLKLLTASVICSCHVLSMCLPCTPAMHFPCVGHALLLCASNVAAIALLSNSAFLIFQNILGPSVTFCMLHNCFLQSAPYTFFCNPLCKQAVNIYIPLYLALSLSFWPFGLYRLG